MFASCMFFFLLFSLPFFPLFVFYWSIKKEILENSFFPSVLTFLEFLSGISLCESERLVYDRTQLNKHKSETENFQFPSTKNSAFTCKSTRAEMGRGIITSSVAFFSDSFSCNKEMDHKSAVVYMNFVPPTYTKKNLFTSKHRSDAK